MPLDFSKDRSSGPRWDDEKYEKGSPLNLQFHGRGLQVGSEACSPSGDEICADFFKWLKWEVSEVVMMDGLRGMGNWNGNNSK